MKRTPFYKLAERIGNDISNGGYFICVDIMASGIEYRKFLKEYFAPTYEECDEYEHSVYVWAAERGEDVANSTGNEFRIMCLLFADLLWQDINK